MKMHKIDPEERVAHIPYRLRDLVAFRIQPQRAAPPQTFEGTITCLPEHSPFECYHIRADGDEWFVLESEIV
jgi:hypothetical protein